MIKKIFLLLIIVSAQVSHAQLLRQESSSLSFFSNAPMEDIYAESKKCISAIDAKKKTFVFIMKPKNFVFKNPLMQEHFNENYMESEKFPKATFSGKITGDFNINADGKYPVKVNGKLNIHGVEKEREISGNIIVKNGKVSIESKFAVKLEEHGVKIPSMMTKKIAEVVEINVNVNYKAHSK